jgi:beta-galactosidase
VGDPALTVRPTGPGTAAGSARYLATVPDEAGVQSVVDHVLAATGAGPVLAGLPEHVEAARRGRLLTLVSHGGPAASVDVVGTDAVSGARIERVELDGYDWAMVVTD